MITAALLVTWAIALLTTVLQPPSTDILFSAIAQLHIPTLASVETFVQVISCSVTRLALDASTVGDAFTNPHQPALTLIGPTATLPPSPVESSFQFKPYTCQGVVEHLFWYLLTSTFVVFALAFTIVAIYLAILYALNDFSDELAPVMREHALGEPDRRLLDEESDSDSDTYYDALAFLKPRTSAQDLGFASPSSTSFASLDTNSGLFSPTLSFINPSTGLTLDAACITTTSASTSSSFITPSSSLVSDMTTYSELDVTQPEDHAAISAAMWDYIYRLEDDSERSRLVVFLKSLPPPGSDEEAVYYEEQLSGWEREELERALAHVNWIGERVCGRRPRGEARRVFDVVDVPLWEPPGPPMLLPSVLDTGWDSWD
ncbi:hypothetical protein C8Q78DRAFT_1006245 [Trametes maxima]|nr:hypothetical protein C8Q78DRAFT_1006245 [Trametes maxima]